VLSGIGAATASNDQRVAETQNMPHPKQSAGSPRMKHPGATAPCACIAQAASIWALGPNTMAASIRNEPFIPTPQPLTDVQSPDNGVTRDGASQGAAWASKIEFRNCWKRYWPPGHRMSQIRQIATAANAMKKLRATRGRPRVPAATSRPEQNR
jgi:hypothetical protein